MKTTFVTRRNRHALDALAVRQLQQELDGAVGRIAPRRQPGSKDH
jgi:hypothetical protein